MSGLLGGWGLHVTLHPLLLRGSCRGAPVQTVVLAGPAAADFFPPSFSQLVSQDNDLPSKNNVSRCVAQSTLNMLFLHWNAQRTETCLSTEDDTNALLTHTSWHTTTAAGCGWKLVQIADGCSSFSFTDTFYDELHTFVCNSLDELDHAKNLCLQLWSWLQNQVKPGKTSSSLESSGLRRMRPFFKALVTNPVHQVKWSEFVSSGVLRF